MITKTETFLRRAARTWPGTKNDSKHTETLRRKTWWLLGFIPLYRHDSIASSNLNP